MQAVLVLFRPLPNVGIQNFGMWGMYNLMKGYRSIQKSIANRRVEDWEASNGHTKDTTRLFHGPWHDQVGELTCVHPCGMWNRLNFHPFLQVSQIFQRGKSDANKQDFENQFNLTCQAQSTPKTTGILSGKFWLWSWIWPWRSRSITPKNNKNLNQGLLHLLSKFGDSSLNGWWVIARTILVTDGRTDVQTQATTLPKGQYWPLVKI